MKFEIKHRYSGAYLRGADLRSANLRGAIGLQPIPRKIVGEKDLVEIGLVEQEKQP